MLSVAMLWSGCDTSSTPDDELKSILDDDDLSSVMGPLAQALTTDAAADGSGRPSLDAGRPADSGMGGGMGGGGGGGGKGGTSFPDGGIVTDAGPDGMGGFGGSDPVDGGPGGSGGGTGGTGGGGSFQRPLGFWNFDDCSEFQTQLGDFSFNNNTAFRSVKAACVAGIAGKALNLPNATDIAYVPDQPTFTFSEGVTIAAWINLKQTGGVQTIFRKREGSSSSLAFVINGKRLQFVISRASGSPASIDIPAPPLNVWTHVAARYDGSSLRLYLNGRLALERKAAGVIADGEGPLLMGNDGSKRRFIGDFDNVWFATRPAPDDEILRLTCVSQPVSLSATPANSGPVPAGGSFTYDLAVTNNNSAACDAQEFLLSSFTFIPNITIDPSFTFMNLASGETRNVPVVVSSTTDAEAGNRQIVFEARSTDFSTPGAVASVDFEVAGPAGCHVKTGRELLIKHLSVVTDAARATHDQPMHPQAGVWTFKHLMEQMAPTPAQAADMVEGMLNTWLSPQTINGFTAPPRFAMQSLVLNSWPRTADGKLDLSRAPLQLEAIVNRFDLRNLDQNNAGEGRFVFGVLDPGGFPMQFTLILEYKLPATTLNDVQAWANEWHALGGLPFPSEEYNVALANLTERFAKRGAAPGRPNGSAITSVRTNEIALEGPWELREFRVDPATGLLRPAPVELTPDLGFNNGSALAEWINANQTAIISEKHVVPLSFNGAPFGGATSFNDLSAWRAPGVDPEARHKFSLNTCNGCHSSEETNTSFLHISPRFPGGEASLSPFMTGTSVFDFEAGIVRTFNDLGRRKDDLTAIVCAAELAAPAPAKGGVTVGGASAGGSPVAGKSTKADLAAKLRHGIRRVH